MLSGSRANIRPHPQGLPLIVFHPSWCSALLLWMPLSPHASQGTLRRRRFYEQELQRDQGPVEALEHFDVDCIEDDSAAEYVSSANQDGIAGLPLGAGERLYGIEAGANLDSLQEVEEELHSLLQQSNARLRSLEDSIPQTRMARSAKESRSGVRQSGSGRPRPPLHAGDSRETAGLSDAEYATFIRTITKLGSYHSPYPDPRDALHDSDDCDPDHAMQSAPMDLLSPNAADMVPEHLLSRRCPDYQLTNDDKKALAELGIGSLGGNVFEDRRDSWLTRNWDRLCRWGCIIIIMLLLNFRKMMGVFTLVEG